MLWGGINQLRFVEEFDLLGDSSVDGLVGNTLVPTRDVGVGLTPCLAVEEHEADGDKPGTEKVSQSDLLTNQEGFAIQVLFYHVNGCLGHVGEHIYSLLVVGTDADQRQIHLHEGDDDFRVKEGHPLQYDGVVLLGLSEKRGLFVLGGN